MRWDDLKAESAVARMGLGLAALGRPGYINLGHADDLEGDYNPEAMRLQAERVLDGGRVDARVFGGRDQDDRLEDCTDALRLDVGLRRRGHDHLAEVVEFVEQLEAADRPPVALAYSSD